ncbi:DUF3850 domain-containing protein [Enterococcus wangshanyuanii]|uniref:DUF3850 domain-containing protein n=1 Tax=Enterococcus wangshanyuanii TaxID=2005703 RepID=A0ABQ1NTI8_9ENTE|nr:DUF3850 domain-containing protein [Enterococcus wangshanyuanii]GGC84438.1 hypothetical protein GCM10011573_12600 [Enterococcus wangshanyuanii]
MKSHDLKIEHQYFVKVICGLKTFEIRKNDRNFEVDDVLILNEINSDSQLTGEIYHVQITYITDYAQQDGYVVMGIVPIEWSSDLEEEVE